MNTFEAGFEFPATHYQLTSAMVDQYRGAVGSEIAAVDYAPPLAVAALAMKTMIDSTFFQPGSIHAAQEFEFFKPVAIGSEISCRANILKTIKRTGLIMITVEMKVSDESGSVVLLGKSTIILPDIK